MSTVTVTPLRQRMIEDMNARKLCVGTQRGHIRACKRFAAFADTLRVGTVSAKPANLPSDGLICRGPMGRPPIGKVAMTGAERTRLYRLKRHVTKPVTKLDSTIEALAAAKARITKLEAENAAALGLVEAQQRELADLHRRSSRQPKKAAKAPLPPDEVRDSRIMALTAEMQRLMLELQHAHEHRAMTNADVKTVAKVLHPDTRAGATDADKDKACRVVTGWPDARKQGRRPA